VRGREGSGLGIVFFVFLLVSWIVSFLVTVYLLLIMRRWCLDRLPIYPT
jgi:hypothetical protein